MKIRNSILSLLISLFIIPMVWGNVFEHKKSLEDISNRIPQFEKVECKFKQQKQLASGIVLNSSGNFRFDKDAGVVFETTYPIQSTTSYTSREYKQINNIIKAITNKSYSRLEKDFEFYYQDGWTLGLLPKQNSQVFDYLKSIEIEGNEKMITKITILTVDLTKTVIYYYN